MSGKGNILIFLKAILILGLLIINTLVVVLSKASNYLARYIRNRSKVNELMGKRNKIVYKANLLEGVEKERIKVKNSTISETESEAGLPKYKLIYDSSFEE